LIENRGFLHMPELPEAERNRALCESNLKGLKLLSVSFLDKFLQTESIAHGNVVHPGEINQWNSIVGKTFLAAHRRAKVIYWKFDGKNTPSPLFTFGMSGSLHLENATALDYKDFKVDTSQFPPKHTRILFEFENDINMAYVCIRGFARVHLFGDPLVELPIREYAPDPVHNMPTPQSFHQSLSRFSKGIKATLLEQKATKGVVCGLGNWLCDDILFEAGIDPDAKSNTLDEEQARRIHHAIVYIISTAIQCNAESHRFPSHWLFHKRWNKKPKKEDLITEDGCAISIKKSGNRTTYFVRNKLLKKGETKSRSSGSSTSGSSTSGRSTSHRSTSHRSTSHRSTSRRSTSRRSTSRSSTGRSSSTGRGSTGLKSNNKNKRPTKGKKTMSAAASSTIKQIRKATSETKNRRSSKRLRTSK
jgi:formamidopyrimidine-DNA glycosylase